MAGLFSADLRARRLWEIDPALLTARGVRGVLLDQTVRGDRQTMTAEIPVAESLELQVEFAKLTSGRGNMATTFSHYAPCPAGFVAERERIGTNPLDRAKYILEKRNALSS